MSSGTSNHSDTETDLDVTAPETQTTNPRLTRTVPIVGSGATSTSVKRKKVRLKSNSDHEHLSAEKAIFSDSEIKLDNISISADPSPEFRKQLSTSGTRYRIEKMLASGGFGNIFLAQDRVLGRKAVIKSLKENLLSQPDIVEHFIAEAKLGSQLDHPSIVPVFSLDTDSRNGLHQAMQYIRGITLKEYLSRARKLQMDNRCKQAVYNKQLRERLEIFLHVCNAVEYAHNRNITHNDLKPENVMIGRFGQVYVMDWGIASFIGTQHENGLSGTPAYMSPECLCTHQTTVLTDVFALGMILNEIATLRGPITGKDSQEVISRICTGKYEPSTCIDSRIKLAPALSAIIESARDPDPELRYQSVRALSDDVRHLLFHEEVRA